MFTRLDDILYPNEVKVIYFHDKEKYVYPIFKNGSSAISESQENNKYKSLINGQIRHLTDIDVFLRNPKDRYRSGFQTYLYNHPDLDYRTIFKLGEQGYILDRHYLPQIHWLLPLMKYMNPEAKIHIHNIQMLANYVPGKNQPIKSDLEVPTNTWMEMALRLDWILWNDMSGQGWTPREILTKLAEDDALAYGTVFKGKGIANVLP